ncbi:MAG: M28 family peptidase [Cyclobacteriaceae bacterium]
MKNLVKSAFYTLLILVSQIVQAQNVPFEQEELVWHLDQELSGESTKRNLEYISRLHRMRGSDDYNKAIDFITQKLKEYKLQSIEVIRIPTDGKTMYGTQKSRPAWNVDFAELWELEQQNGDWKQKTKIADWESIPLVVAQDSHSGEVKAELVDIGSGTSESDYANKELRGKLVLTSSQPGAVVPLAVEKYGAAGIISYAQNQVTAWWKENENLIRWGHLSTFSETKTFAFMISLKQARNFQERFVNGESIRLHAKVVAQQTPGSYDVLTAVIEGSDPELKEQEIAYTCHLDHPRPGANDNASGCMAILEVARTLNKLIAEGKIERPKRTLRFIWSPEIEGTTALLNFKPEYAEKIKFNIHMDMVGGGPETKAIFHVSRSPMSVASFTTDVGTAFGSFVNKSSIDYSSGVSVPYPIVSKEGGKEALHAVLGEFHMGSDFEVFTEGSFRIPSIYLHDWPDRYIHTNYDEAANIDPTKLKRSSFIGAGSGYFLANLSAENVPQLVETMKRQLLARSSALLSYCKSLSAEDQENTKYYFWQNEVKAFHSLKAFASVSSEDELSYIRFITNLKIPVGEGEKYMMATLRAPDVYTRNSKVKGPMSVFGYDYFADHYGTDKKSPAIYGFTGTRGVGYEYAYEALNLVNGKNDVIEIRNILSAQFGEIPLEHVEEYLKALASIDVVKLKK